VAPVEAERVGGIDDLSPTDLPQLPQQHRSSPEDERDILDQEDYEGVVGEPTMNQSAAVEVAICDMLCRATINGASTATITALREVVLKHKDVWRV
jgi:hypothetical protein